MQEEQEEMERLAKQRKRDQNRETGKKKTIGL